MRVVCIMTRLCSQLQHADKNALQKGALSAFDLVCMTRLESPLLVAVTGLFLSLSFYI